MVYKQHNRAVHPAGALKHTEGEMSMVQNCEVKLSFFVVCGIELFRTHL